MKNKTFIVIASSIAIVGVVGLIIMAIILYNWIESASIISVIGRLGA